MAPRGSRKGHKEDFNGTSAIVQAQLVVFMYRLLCVLLWFPQKTTAAKAFGEVFNYLSHFTVREEMRAPDELAPREQSHRNAPNPESLSHRFGSYLEVAKRALNRGRNRSFSLC